MARLQDLFYNALDSSTDECILWPSGALTGGYGQFWHRGRNRRVHVVMCTLAHGDRPTEDHQAAHSCNVRLCINPRHLSWKTPKENNADKIGHGTQQIGERHPLAKMTEEKVLAIRKAYAEGQSQGSLGREYGMTQAGISLIVRRLTWSHLDELIG